MAIGSYTVTAYTTSAIDSSIVGSIATSVTVTRPITALQLSPATLTMMAGDGQGSLGLTDQNSNPVTGAAWTSDNPSVLTLDPSSDPPQITEIGVGTANVIASIAGLSATAAITVIPYGRGHTPPTGTVLWSTPPTPGFTLRSVTGLTPGAGSVAFVGVEADSAGNTILHGVGGGGQDVWRMASPLPASSISSVLADGDGGLLMLDWGAASLSRIDGAGNLSWQNNPQAPVGRFFRFGMATQSGVVYAVQNLFDAPGTINGVYGPNFSAHGFLVALDIATGAMLANIPLPVTHVRSVAFTGTVADEYYGGSTAGPISVLPDGSVAFEVATNDDLATDTVYTGLGNCAYTNSLYSITLLPNGTTSTTVRQQATGNLPQWPCPQGVWGFRPAEVIPDGQGGSLLSYVPDILTPPTAAHVAHIDNTGAQVADFVLPLQDYGNRPSSLILGEGTTAFITDSSAVVSFDVNAGAVNFNQPAPAGHTFALIAALWRGWVAVTDSGGPSGPVTDYFDAAGNLAYNSGGSTAGLHPGDGDWYSTAGTYQSVQKTGLLLPDFGPWPMPGGNPVGNRSPVMATIESIPQWGANAPIIIPPLQMRCLQPITINGTTLPAKEPVTDANSDPKLLQQLNDMQKKLIDSNTLASKTCAAYFADPKRAQFYGLAGAGLAQAVTGQQRFNGSLSVINFFDAGLYSPTKAKLVPALTDYMKTLWVSCKMAKPNPKKPTEQIVAVTQAVPPATDAYFNDYALPGIVPSTLLHEALHNLTHTDDGELRILLDEDRLMYINQNSSADINGQLEFEGCAGPPLTP